MISYQTLTYALVIALFMLLAITFLLFKLKDDNLAKKLEEYFENQKKKDDALVGGQQIMAKILKEHKIESAEQLKAVLEENERLKEQLKAQS